MVSSTVGLNRGCGQFLIFLGTANGVFLPVNVSFRWLNNVLNTGFFASYWSAGFGRFLQASGFASHWLWRIV